MMKKSPVSGERTLARVKGVGGIILGVSENRSWIELLYEGDLMHGKQVELPSGILDIFIEEIPHKCTIYEHPRTIIYLEGPSALEIVRDGNRIVVRGSSDDEAQDLKRSPGSAMKSLTTKRQSRKRAR